MIFELIVATLGVLLAIWLILNNNSSTLVPGPSGLPFFGYWPSFLGDKPYELFDHWAKQYGDIFRIRIGFKEYFVLNTFDAIRQAYIQDGNNFTSRPLNYNLFGATFEFRPMPFKNGPEWALQRTLFGNIMRRKDGRLETAIAKSTKGMVRRIETVASEGGIDVYKILGEGALNAISMLICGQHLMETEPEIGQQIIRDARMIENVPTGDGWIDGWIIRMLANPYTTKYKNLTEATSRQFRVMQRFLDDHRSTFDPSNIRDYIDICLYERLHSKSPTVLDWLSDDNLVANMFVLFVAGIDTTATTLYMALFLLAKHSQVQEKCYDELQGLSCDEIKCSDRSKFPYLSATANEINRYAVIGALPQPRQNDTKTTLCGYEIPAGSHFVTNLWSATRDPKHFQNPNVFDPENFFGKNMPKDLASLAFSVGKRGCPGENFANSEIFLFLTHLLLTFRISPPSDVVDMEEVIIPGFVRCLAPYKLIFTRRDIG